MDEKIRVIQYGAGPIGASTAGLVLKRPNLELVGIVDISPELTGKDAGEVIGLGNRIDVPIHANLNEVLVTHTADVALHTTSSHFNLFLEQILELLNAGLDIVSTSEELSFPWLAHPEEAAKINSAARKAGKTVLGTGVNPGFLMDTLPLVLTGISEEVERIDIIRRINASQRRGPFQAKIGSGLTAAAFNERMAAGSMGHIGLPQSIGMVFETLGKKLVRYEDEVEPILAKEMVETKFFKVPAGKAIGLKQTANGYSPEGLFMTLTFVAALDLEDEGDHIHITGIPDLSVTLEGTNGDIATRAITVNAIPRVLSAPPGLFTMRDLPIIVCQ